MTPQPTPDPDAALVEQVARAICPARGWPPDLIWNGRPSWHICVPEARAAIKAVREGDEWRTSVARIADDFHPDRDEDAPAALQEMRDALWGLVAYSPPPVSP